MLACQLLAQLLYIGHHSSICSYNIVYPSYMTARLCSVWPTRPCHMHITMHVNNVAPQ